MYRIAASTRFKRDLRIALKRGYNIALLEVVVTTLAAGDTLDERYLDHPLRGDYQGCRECHITPDWLLVYEIENDELILHLTRTGTHSDLF